MPFFLNTFSICERTTRSCFVPNGNGTMFVILFFSFFPVGGAKTDYFLPNPVQMEFIFIERHDIIGQYIITI